MKSPNNLSSDQGFILTTVEDLVNWSFTRSTWPVTMGLACCSIEMMAFGGAPRFDSARFGMEVFRASPRQADLMLVNGRINQKMAPVVRDIYDQMADPKWVISMGACACSGGLFNNYAVVQGSDHVVPVDIYLPGCPPRPDALIYAVLELRKRIQADHHLTKAGREAAIRAAEEAALKATPTFEMKGLLA
ncbi:MAG: NADH-quinone oxidoreductase subunit B [Actinomycetaceae bacterium]|nr:NADH-quinone oxidoreductase subunit B [Actinomycetaceae bacterium]